MTGGGSVTISFTMPRARLDQLLSRDLDAAPPRASQKAGVVLAGDAVALKPAMHRKQVNPRVVREVLPGGPPLNDGFGGGDFRHAHKIMTKSVISQWSQNGD